MASAATNSYSPGAGGRIQKRPKRRPTTPYDRPSPFQLIPGRSLYKGLLSRLVDPASRLFQSVFPLNRLPSLPAPVPNVDAPESSTLDGNDLSCKEKREEHIENDATETTESSESMIDELEQLLKQKTFTREEYNRLTGLLRSRTVGLFSNDRKPDMQFTEIDPGTSNNVICEDQRKYLSGLQQGIEPPGATLSLPGAKFNATKVCVEDIASPAELAKAYMGARTSRVAIPTLGLRNQILREDTHQLGVASFSTPLSAGMPSRSTVNFHGNGSLTSRTQDRFRMTRKVSGVQDKTEFTGGQPRLTSILNRPSLKRRSSMMDNDFGSGGSIRRIRQKSSLWTPSKNISSSPSGICSVARVSRFGSSAAAPYPLEASVSSRQKQKLHTEDSIPPASVPSQSSETARKILQQLDKLIPSPKDKSPELNIIKKSPQKLTSDMLNSRALRSMESESKLPIAVACSSDGPNKDIPKPADVGSTDHSVVGSKPILDADHTNSPEATPEKIIIDDSVISSSVPASKEVKQAFCMSAPEDLAELEDDTSIILHTSTDEQRSSTGATSAVSEDASKFSHLASEKLTAEQSGATGTSIGTSCITIQNKVGFTSDCQHKAFFDSYSKSVLVASDALDEVKAEESVGPPVSLPSAVSAISCSNLLNRSPTSESAAASHFASVSKSTSAFALGSRLSSATVASSCSSFQSSWSFQASDIYEKSNLFRESSSFSDVNAGGIFGSSNATLLASVEKPVSICSKNGPEQLEYHACPTNTAMSTVPNSNIVTCQGAMLSLLPSGGDGTTSTSEVTSVCSLNTQHPSSSSADGMSSQVVVSATSGSVVNSQSATSCDTYLAPLTVTSTSPGSLVFGSRSADSTFSVPASFTNSFTACASTAVNSGLLGLKSENLTAPLSHSNSLSVDVVISSSSSQIVNSSTASSSSHILNFPFSGTCGLNSQTASSCLSASDPAAVGPFKYGSSATSAVISSSTSNTDPPRTSFAFGSCSASSSGFSFGQSSAAASPIFSFGQPSTAVSTAFSFGQSSTAVSTPFSFGQSSASASTASFGQSSASPVASGFTFGQASPSSSGFSLRTSSVPSTTVFSFGKPSAPSSGFSFGPSSTAFSFGQTSAQNAPPVFGGSPDSAAIFSFGLGTKSTSSSTFVSTQSVFHGPSSFAALGSPSPSNDQMNVEESMAEDITQASSSQVSPLFTQSTSVFAPSPGGFGTSTFQTGGSPVFFGVQNMPTAQNMTPFTANTANLGVPSGGSFSIGTGDKGNRKFVKVRRDKHRRK